MSAEVEVGVVVCSDTLDFISDEAGKLMIDLCEARGWRVLAYEIIPKDQLAVCDAVLRVVDYPGVDVLFTVGGTGSHARDFTREATHEIAEGTASCTATVLDSLLRGAAPGQSFRGTAVQHGKTVVVNMPDSEAFISRAFDPVAAAVLGDLGAELC